MLLAALVLSAVMPGVSAANTEEKPGGKRPTVLLIPVSAPEEKQP